MRQSANNNGLEVQAIAGTYVVTLGINMDDSRRRGCLGFSIHRVDHTENEAYYLKGMKVFEETDPGLPAGSLHSTKDQLLQSFYWADYSAKPGHRYTYTIYAKKGTPSNLETYKEVSVEVTTESVIDEVHNVYFNRGIAASQEYIRRFGNRDPEDVPNKKAYEWLSRGLYEALEEYIMSCKPGKHSLRIAAYEFYYEGILDLISTQINNGVDIKFVFDARKKSPREKNIEKITDAGLMVDGQAFPRATPASYISHNKFIVKLENDHPISVWTGGTNFSEGGIFGHSNVAQVVNDSTVAQSFLDYWDALAQDLSSRPTKDIVENISPLFEDIPQGTSMIFSPRKDLDALSWYADLAKSAKHGLFMTFAFGMNDLFKEVYENSTADIRFALLDKKIRGMKASPAKTAEIKRMDRLRWKNENVFAIGSFIRTNKIDGWVKERLSGLNFHVNYIHNKFMLIDPLSDDPIVIGGSANFSDASTRRNDENMLVIRGNTRVADIYFGEYMRLYSHHAFREWAPKGKRTFKYLKSDDSWSDIYFDGSSREIRRKYFSGNL